MSGVPRSRGPGAGAGRRRRSLLSLVFCALVSSEAAPYRGSESSQIMAQPDTLAVTLAAPDTVRRGKPVPLTLIVTNQTDRRLTLYLRGRKIAFDMTVSRGDGSVVWRRLEGQVVPAILRVEELEARGRIVLRETWTQRDARGKPVPPGTYDLEGSVLTDGDPLVSPRRRLRIR